MRNALICLLGLILATASYNALADKENPKEPRFASALPTQFWKTRPVRRDTPLREENITDLEIVEIEAEMKALYPGSIVYVSAVTTGCPCEDGPDCTDLVWSVATSGNMSKGIALSNIEGVWQLGPLQEWWLDYDVLWASYRASNKDRGEAGRISYHEHMERVTEHYETFPACNDTTELDQLSISPGATHREAPNQQEESEAT